MMPKRSFVRGVLIALALIGVIGWWVWAEAVDAEMEVRTGARHCTTSIRGTRCKCLWFGPYDIFIPHGQTPTARCPGK